MTTLKITTFLMCPTSAADALGGTPSACDVAGGHIRKADWQHVHCLAARFAQQLQNRRNQADQEDGGSEGLTGLVSADGDTAKADRQQEADDVGHSGEVCGLRDRCVGFGRACEYQLFERDDAAGEVAHGKHVFRRNAVVRHLAHAANGKIEMFRQSRVAAPLFVEPRFEFHSSTLEQPKGLSQGFSKACFFMLA